MYSKRTYENEKKMRLACMCYSRLLSFVSDITTPTINKIRISNLVFDDGNIQTIIGPKHFKNDVIISGDATVELINGINITKEFENSLHGSGNAVNINGNIVSIYCISIIIF